MFSGIVEELGRIRSRGPRGGFSVLEISAERILTDAKKGDSISVNGVCLTVEETGGKMFNASLSRQTLTETSLGSLQQGDYVNLERALMVGDRIGGHFLSGHVDCTLPVSRLFRQSDSVILSFRVAHRYMRYIAERGSVGVDGISLTVAKLDGTEVSVYLVPHTVETTTLKYRRPGDKVNIEFDMLARYVERCIRYPGEGGRDKNLWAIED